MLPTCSLEPRRAPKLHSPKLLRTDAQVILDMPSKALGVAAATATTRVKSSQVKSHEVKNGKDGMDDACSQSWYDDIIILILWYFDN